MRVRRMTGRVFLLVAMAGCGFAQAQTGPSGWADGKGARVRIPPGWTINQRLIESGGPIAMTNFGGAYASGGVLPPLGAEIEITSVANPPNLTEYIHKELRGVQGLNLREASAGPNSGIRAEYVESVGSALTATTLVFYIPRGPNLFKFYLTYGTNHPDPRALGSLLEQEVREAALR